VIVGEPLSLMITSSPGPGTVPVLQLLPTFQLPLVGEIQSTVDNNCRGSSTSTVGRLRFRLPRWRYLRGLGTPRICQRPFMVATPGGWRGEWMHFVVNHSSQRANSANQRANSAKSVHHCLGVPQSPSQSGRAGREKWTSLNSACLTPKPNTVELTVKSWEAVG